ncbi:MAG: hypothetical protein A2W90_13260 [Bacteroidetes bacterium GWF2_42_66]|nr:MAG: hypothetical protein A2W92_19230 [Bacteroidetes bacterium GWA2_42_15]OFY00217.1 MAG: hypothetical protein A2W89_18250 [Bacteroidetes bacterium GWE2_42_39]OFY40359.1 MAG: hypothetical protein A2W90_13260 [Bacteroidetes bacterium GWF2_42_66]HBL73687.1 hypothetical protein [Prolixibacteraceae bacterium]HCR90697.1 hypothetical protein [Prolixibacteraceae bacterium]
MNVKTRMQLEYIIKCSPKVLYNRLSNAAGLAEWFAENVTVKGKIYTFTWEGVEQQAEKTLHKENQLVRFSWVDDDDDDSYFEFRITQDELTGDVSLIVIDFAEENETEGIKNLWDTQIADLKHILGS